MNWVEIERRHHAKYQRDYIMCREPEERNFLVNAILEAYTFVKREDVEKTFDHFCSVSVQPPESDLFLARIKEHLGKQLTAFFVKHSLEQASIKPLHRS